MAKRKKKKKSRFGYYLYAFVVLILTIAIIVISALLLFHVQEIEIHGTKYSKSENILELIKEDPYTTNSLYTYAKFKAGAYEKPIYLENIKVTLGAPWKIKVNVKEKQIAACTRAEKQYIYFDKDGLVLVKGRKLDEEVPEIGGLEAKNAEVYKKLPVTDEKVFSYIVRLTEELNKNQMKPDSIVWENDSMNIYFEKICVQLGKSRFDEKLKQIPPILENLKGKEGILHLEHYNETSTNISFQQYAGNAE